MPAREIVVADVRHLPHLAAHMREQDRREVWAASRHTPEEALQNAFYRSALAWTCLLHGRPALIWGVCPAGSLSGRTGLPWLLGTSKAENLGLDLARHSRGFVGRMQALFPRLENYVHADNAVSLRWLAWCGFTVDTTPRLAHGEPFYLFFREREEVGEREGLRGRCPLRHPRQGHDAPAPPFGGESL